MLLKNPLFQYITENVFRQKRFEVVYVSVFCRFILLKLCYTLNLLLWNSIKIAERSPIF